MPRPFILVALSLVLAVSSVQAQGAGRTRTGGEEYSVSSPLVTAAASQDQVRFTALALTQKIRLEVLSENGESLYDSDFQPGNRLEWTVKDQQGSELRDGVYGCLVTVADLYGQMTQRRAVFRVKDGSVSFDTTNREHSAVGSDDQENLTILPSEDPSPFTIVSHDGYEGWVESASGGLSFYAGNLSRSRDGVPHLRLTPEGNLGIGVAEPSARLDVAGLIRASEGFQFSDGTVLKTEGGLPVLVSGSSDGRGENSAGAAGKTARFLAVGGSIGMLFVSGSSGRVFGSEGGAPYYNTLYGLTAGGALTTGNWNSFFGYGAGLSNTAGYANSLFGYNAGLSNTAGYANSFFGYNAGYYNATGEHNSFVGSEAGLSNTAGSDNSFFGAHAGLGNTIGVFNTFVGSSSGGFNTTGNANSFFGNNAGHYNLTGEYNSFVGNEAGRSNTTGNDNSFFGAHAGLGNTIGVFNTFVGSSSGGFNTTGNANSVFGYNAGLSNVLESNNSFIGSYSDGAAGTTNATALGYRAKVTKSNSLVLGSINGVNGASADSNVGIGTTAPGAKLDIVGIWGAPGSSIPTSWALRTSGRRGIVNGNRGFYEDVYGSYAELSTYKWDDGTTLPLVFNANGGNVGIGTTTPGATLDVIGLYGPPGASIPTGWANRVTGRRGVVNGNRGFYEDIFQGPSGFYAELSTCKWDDGTALPLVFNANGGNVGIGTTAPGATLDVVGPYGAPGASIPTGWANRVTGRRGVVNGNRGFYEDIIISSNTYAELSTYKWDDGTTLPLVFNANGGNVGIGTTNPTQKLHVAGNLRVTGQILYGAPDEDLPDYVFEPDYKLMPVEDLAKFVAKEKHLPNIPAASEIKEKGLNLGEFQMKLLEKIEELTLYTVRQARTVTEQQEKLQVQQGQLGRKDAEIAALNARLSVLEQMMERLARQEQK